jgi:type II secretory pathway component PulC
MTEPRVTNASFRRFNAVATLIIFVAVVGVAYRYDRFYRRWSKENSPLTAPSARVERLRTRNRERLANVTELSQVIGSVLDEVARAK